jgi:dTMP kinase
MHKLSQRGGYGEERYEKLDFQKKVKRIYEEFLVENNWIQFDAEKSIEEIHKEIVEKFSEKSKEVMPELKHF